MVFPACGMFHQITVFDLLLPRILTGETIGRRELAELGHGGLCRHCTNCRYPACDLGNNKECTSHHRMIVSKAETACDLLASSTGLAKVRIKDAMTKGAVWLERPGKKEQRIRKATSLLLPGDQVELYYDPEILSLTPQAPRLIAEEKHYSAWYKPANLLTQGTRYGDHCSLIRCAEVFFKYRKEIRLVHRLDREAFGLVLLAHTRQGAAALSDLFRKGEIEKRYRAEVSGKIGSMGETLTLSSPLVGKKAVTIVTVTAQESDSSSIDILLRTGRFHQIRRHLSLTGYPILGDPRYGIKGKTSDLPLAALRLQPAIQVSFYRKNY